MAFSSGPVLAPPSCPVFICPEIFMESSMNELLIKVINLIFNLKRINLILDCKYSTLE